MCVCVCVCVVRAESRLVTVVTVQQDVDAVNILFSGVSTLNWSQSPPVTFLLIEETSRSHSQGIKLWRFVIRLTRLSANSSGNPSTAKRDSESHWGSKKCKKVQAGWLDGLNEIGISSRRPQFMSHCETKDQCLNLRHWHTYVQAPRKCSRIWSQF